MTPHQIPAAGPTTSNTPHLYRVIHAPMRTGLPADRPGRPRLIPASAPRVCVALPAHEAGGAR